MKTARACSCHRRWSAAVTDGVERAASRAMLHAVGFSRGDFRKSQVGIASAWSRVTPCNMHIDKLARHAEAGVNAAGGKAVVFNTITVSDGISMGTEGMKYSLVSREVIADSIEAVMGCEAFDGLVAFGGCDKNMPGCLIAIARLNRPAVFVYGGTILPGRHRGRYVDIVSVFESEEKALAAILDGRFSGGSHGLVVGHITPEAFAGGPLALVRNGDRIRIDAERRELTLAVPAAELTRRRRAWKPPRPHYTRGLLAKYARQVSPASLGAVTDA